MRRTKIVCTIGPATESIEMIEALVRAGMDVARLNFSHGTLEEHRARIERIRQPRGEAGQARSASSSTSKGPRSASATLASERRRTSHKGEQSTSRPHPIRCRRPEDAKRCRSLYPPLLEQVRPGQTIYLDDGLVELRVEEIETTGRVAVRRDRRRASSAQRRLAARGRRGPAGDRRDRLEHIRFGVKTGVDFVAASFVRRAGARRSRAGRDPSRRAAHQQVIAKIESREGVRNIDEHLRSGRRRHGRPRRHGRRAAPEEVPLVQKSSSRSATESGKPVITATQMLDSMARNPRPTRAEVTDVANAIFDGTDAVMLSGRDGGRAISGRGGAHDGPHRREERRGARLRLLPRSPAPTWGGARSPTPSPERRARPPPISK